jgi:hypothetical protein
MRVAKRRRMDFTVYPMGLIGGLIALFVFGVFIGTWWWYGMREMERRAKAQSPVVLKQMTRLSAHDAHAHPSRT